MEGAMDGRQLVIPGLQPAGLPDPGQGPLDHIADLAQAAPVRRPRGRQVVLDPPLLEALMIPRRAVLPVPVQRLGLPPRPPTPPPDRRDVIHEVHRLQRLVAVGPGDAQGQRSALAIDQQVPFGAFFRDFSTTTGTQPLLERWRAFIVCSREAPWASRNMSS